MKVDPRSYECNYMQLRKEAWKKIQDFNGVWTRDFAIALRRSNQLSYEATDVGSRSIVLMVYYWHEWEGSSLEKKLTLTTSACVFKLSIFKHRIMDLRLSSTPMTDWKPY